MDDKMENGKLQVRFHPHAVWSSLARTDSHGFLAPWSLKNERSNHTCWKSGKWKTDAQRRQQVEVLHLFRCFTHTDTRVYTHRERECVCACAEGLKLSKKAHRKIRVLVSITNLTRMYGGDANDGMPSHHEWTNLGGDDSRDACGSYCILLIQLFYRYFGGTQKWKNINSSRKEPSKVMFEPNKHRFK